jgi:transposase
MRETVVRYSEAFKRQIVGEIEAGRYKSFQEAREAYGVTGCGTVEGWIKRYGKTHLLCRIVRVEVPEERDQIKELKKRVKELEKALADTKVEEVLARAYFEILCEDCGVKDPEGFKKKHAIKP